MMLKSDSIASLASALSSAQGELKHASKDKTNPFFNSTYADLANVIDTMRDVLSKNGLSIMKLVGANGQDVSVETVLMHKPGEWVSTTLTMRATKGDPQGIGSCITYARRYSLSAIVGIASEEDDDGNAASQHQEQQKQQKQQQKPKQQAVNAQSDPEKNKSLQVYVKSLVASKLKNEELMKYTNEALVKLKKDAVKSSNDLTAEDMLHILKLRAWELLTSQSGLGYTEAEAKDYIEKFEFSDGASSSTIEGIGQIVRKAQEDIDVMPM